MAKIRIVACPPGEAPEEVRRAWIGLELPLLEGKHGRQGWNFAAGVVSAPRRRWLWWLAARLGLIPVTRGYTVDAARALAILEAAHPSAGAWWRANCAFLYQPKHYLVFAAHVCEELP